MALPASRRANRGTRGGLAAGYEGGAGGTPGGSEHDYSDDRIRARGRAPGTANHQTMGSPASVGASKGRGPIAGAGEQQYGTHGDPGRAARGYAGMPSGAYPSRKTPTADVGKISVYESGNPPPRGYSQGGGGMRSGASSGRIGRTKASSTY